MRRRSGYATLSRTSPRKFKSVVRQWDEIRDNTWSRLAKCMQLLDMQLKIPEEGKASEASEISWAKLTRPLRKFRWRAEAVGGKQVCFDQQIWRMSRCQWATIFRCEKSFLWERHFQRQDNSRREKVHQQKFPNCSVPKINQHKTHARLDERVRGACGG